MVPRVFAKRCMLTKFAAWISSDHHSGILASDHSVKHNGHFSD